MKRVAIVTLNGYHNLGNRLQNYALHETLKKLGCQADTLLGQIDEDMMVNSHLKRFSDLYLDEVKVDFSDAKQTRLLNNRYDYFVVGSDQVWNCNYCSVINALPIYFLQFAQPEKRLSYAASFGLTQLPDHAKKAYITRLNGMSTLSVREQAGVDIIRELCARKATVHVDPTLLLTKEEYKKLARPHKAKPKGRYIAVNFLSQLSESKLDEIRAFAESRHLSIVFINRLLNTGEIGAEEFLDYISDAECVLTDSFHSSVFSILFEKPFLVHLGNLMEISSRLDTLLNLLHLENRVYRDKNSLEHIFQVDYKEKETILDRERQKSMEYLKTALDLPREEKAYVVPKKEMCYGCTACMSVCPQNCITMQPDSEGFSYPIIDEKECIHCNLCEEACPALHPHPQEGTSTAVAVINSDETIRMQSTSGGTFTALAQKVIEDGGVVFGAVMDKNMRVVHRSAKTVEKLDGFRGSKYVQSDLGDCFQRVKELLISGRKVLFTGTPCQVAGLKAALGGDDPNLIAVDMVCHGVPSPLAWEKYVAYRERTANSKMVAAWFRSKHAGWHDSSLRYQFADGSVMCQQPWEEQYTIDFLSDYSLRTTCYQCKFKNGYRASDLTLADFWGVEDVMPEADDNKGISLVLIHNEKGQEMLNGVKEQLVTKQVNMDEVLAYNAAAVISSINPGNRSVYFESLKKGEKYV